MVTKIDESVKMRLRVMLEKSGLTSHAYAQSVHIDPSAFAKKLKGSLPVTNNDLGKLEKFGNVSKGWLLTGEGEMLNENNTKDSQDSQVGIPLIPQAAMAGALGGSDSQWMGYQCERYLIPGFEDCDFLIRIEGDSMMPDYYPGDIVACKIVVMSKLWFQWGEVYILDTCQGALLKRILPSEVDNCVKIVSSNSKYPPFDLEVTEIHHVSLVKGLIRK